MQVRLTFVKGRIDLQAATSDHNPTTLLKSILLISVVVAVIIKFCDLIDKMTNGYYSEYTDFIADIPKLPITGTAR